MEMDIKWCCIIFQDGTNLMQQSLHKILLFCNVCPQISSSWARSPINNINFVWKAWNVFSKHIVYLKHSSTMHNMLWIIINISSMMMTFVNFSFVWGSKGTKHTIHVLQCSVQGSCNGAQAKCSNAYCY